MLKGTFYIVAAPSGGGKSSVVKAVVNDTENLKISISYTTRPCRTGEEHGTDYFFVSEDEFSSLESQNEFIETADVYGYRYGTSRTVIEKFLSDGIDVILDIDWQGAKRIKKLAMEHTSIYLLPPSRDELVRRLEKRGRDPKDVIQQRMREVAKQVKHCSDFDYIIVNDSFDETVADFKAIIRSSRLGNSLQLARHENILQSLLAAD